MIKNIDKVITYRDAYGVPTTSFYYKGAEVNYSKLRLDRKLQGLIKDNVKLFENNSKIIRIISKV